ncbi:hypothetical protein JHK86_024807 [Glycine max]|nr:hypothetical protein JHK86_024807 [Glycine max]
MKFEACKKATSGLSVACFRKTLAPPCLNSNRVISLSSLLPETLNSKYGSRVPLLLFNKDDIHDSSLKGKEYILVLKLDNVATILDPKNQDDEQVLSSKLSPRTKLVCYHPRISFSDVYFTYLDMHYPYISPNNVIKVCSPNPLMHYDFHLLFQKLATYKGWCNVWMKLSMLFSFRNKFPKIVVFCSVMPSSHTLLVYMFSVLINGSKQFSSSCKYIFLTWDPIHWCDLQCKAEAIFSEHEWNEVEILSELKPTHMFGREIVNWTLFGVYEEGNNKEDIEFKNPIENLTQATKTIKENAIEKYYIINRALKLLRTKPKIKHYSLCLMDAIALSILMNQCP